MRLLSALYHEDIEEYIKYLPEIEAVDVVKDKKSLLDALDFESYDVVLLSKELPGSEDIEFVFEVLAANKNRNQRIVYLYGEYDSLCDDFIRYLLGKGIYDFFIGDEITSRDIERLIFKPACKDAAFAYFKSRYDNELHYDNTERKSRNNSRIFNNAIIKPGFKPFLKTSKRKRLPFEKLIISIISNQATGKSHTAWNLSYCFSKHGYATSLLNIDRGYSANLFFDIDELYYDLLDFTMENNKHKDILDSCCKKKNLSIITGKLGDEKEIEVDDFAKLLYSIRTKSDITIIDTRTGMSELTRLSIKNSIYDLLIFDCDIMHYHMNMKMLEELQDDFVPEKTIAVINSTNVKSSSHKFIFNELKSSGIPFKDIAFLSSCCLLSSELMHTGLVPYQAAGEEYKSFSSDMDSLLDKLSARQG